MLAFPQHVDPFSVAWCVRWAGAAEALVAYIGEALAVANERLKPPHILAAFEQFLGYQDSQLAAAAAAGDVLEGDDKIAQSLRVQLQQATPEALMERCERETMLQVGPATITQVAQALWKWQSAPVDAHKVLRPGTSSHEWQMRCC